MKTFKCAAKIFVLHHVSNLPPCQPPGELTEMAISYQCLTHRWAQLGKGTQSDYFFLRLCALSWIERETGVKEDFRLTAASYCLVGCGRTSWLSPVSSIFPSPDSLSSSTAGSTCTWRIRRWTRLQGLTYLGAVKSSEAHRDCDDGSDENAAHDDQGIELSRREIHPFTVTVNGHAATWNAHVVGVDGDK